MNPLKLRRFCRFLSFLGLLHPYTRVFLIILKQNKKTSLLPWKSSPKIWIQFLNNARAKTECLRAHFLPPLVWGSSNQWKKELKMELRCVLMACCERFCCWIFVWLQYPISLYWSAITESITCFYPGKLFMRYCGKYSETISCGKAGDVNLYNVVQVTLLKQPLFIKVNV